MLVGNGGAVATHVSLGVSASLSLNFIRTSFLSNAGNRGGAAYFDASDVKFDTCTFSNNIATIGGGGIYVGTESTLTISNSVFDANSIYDPFPPASVPDQLPSVK